MSYITTEQQYCYKFESFYCSAGLHLGYCIQYPVNDRITPKNSYAYEIIKPPPPPPEGTFWAGGADEANGSPPRSPRRSMVLEPEDWDEWLCCPGEEKLCDVEGTDTGGGCWAAWFFGVVWGDWINKSMIRFSSDSGINRLILQHDFITYIQLMIQFCLKKHAFTIDINYYVSICPKHNATTCYMCILVTLKKNIFFSGLVNLLSVQNCFIFFFFQNFKTVLLHLFKNSFQLKCEQKIMYFIWKREIFKCKFCGFILINVFHLLDNS